MARRLKWMTQLHGGSHMIPTPDVSTGNPARQWPGARILRHDTPGTPGRPHLEGDRHGRCRTGTEGSDWIPGFLPGQEGAVPDSRRRPRIHRQVRSVADRRAARDLAAVHPLPARRRHGAPAVRRHGLRHGMGHRHHSASRSDRPARRGAARAVRAEDVRLEAALLLVARRLSLVAPVRLRDHSGSHRPADLALYPVPGAYEVLLVVTVGAAGSAMAKPRVVIIGGGFGGLSAARALRGAPVD